MVGRHRYGAGMRALILHGPGDLRLEEAPRPEPGDGEIVVAVEAALTCATDAKMLARGRHPALGPLPAPFGHEGAGTVAATGPGVRTVVEGDPVALANSAPCGRCEWCRAGREGLCPAISYLTGTYAEFLRVPAPIVAANVVRRPAGLAAPLAALAEPVACGVRAAERSGAAPGESVIVIGGGLQGQVIAAVLAGRGCRGAGVRSAPGAPRARHADGRRGGRRTARPFRHRARAGPDPRRPRGPRGVRRRGRGGRLGGRGRARPARRRGQLPRGPAPDEVLRLPASRLHYEELTLQASYHHTPAAFRRALAIIDGDRELFGALLGPEIGLEQVADALVAGGPKRVVRPGPSAGGSA